MSISLKRAGQFGLVSIVALVAVIGYSLNSFTPADEPFYRSAPPLAITGFNLEGGSQRVFQTWFDPRPTVWRGEVSAYAVGDKGQVEMAAPIWQASVKLRAQNLDETKWTDDPPTCDTATAWLPAGRRIVTRNGSNSVAFQWANLSDTQKTSIGATETIQKNVLNYVRGDPKNEKQINEVQGDGSPGPIINPCGSATGTFRGRASELGDIINGKPVYIGKPAADYSFDNYPAFKLAQANRAGRVYVGANDGMLHAFNATTDPTTQGTEVFAYIPSMLIPKLSKLTVNPYVHTYFVDGGLAAGDAYFARPSQAIAWHTVLVGALGAGGKGLFALDVTDPAAANEDDAKAKIMWEITEASTGFADLGYIYGEASIVRLNSGKWAAIVGNGYNNSGSFKSVLYVIDIADGSLIRAITVGTGATGNPGGLSSPRVVDTNSDGKADLVYAGDIDGKLWKFDISDPNPALWATPAAPLFDAGSTTSIMGVPDVVSHPNGGLLVYFGTGRLFTKAHANDRNAQNYAYGIWDGAPAANKIILEQELFPAEFGAAKVRVSNGLPVNWTDSSKPLHMGWKTKLPLGEHIVTSGFVRDSRYHFTSYLSPKDATTTPAAAAVLGESWVNQLDYLNGSTNGSPIFDFSGDDALNDADRVPDAAGDPTAGPLGVPIGIRLGDGLFSEPLLALVSRDLSVTLFNQTVLPNTGCSPNCESGIAGGHFDFDVYHDYLAGSFQHTHEYDDKFNVVGASFTNASSATYNLANTAIKGNRVIPPGGAGTASKFFVLVSNGDLSPGVTYTVAGGTGKAYEAKAFQYPNEEILASIKAKGKDSPYLFDSNTVKKFQWVMPFDGLNAKDWGQGVSRPGLIPTATGCVKSGTRSNPGLLGENNNGALTTWIVGFVPGLAADAYDPGKGIIDLNVAGKPEKGYLVVSSNAAYHLKHYTVFWHAHVGCYGDGGWIPSPVPDDPNATGGARPPGSEDPTPGAGSGAPTAISTTTNVVLDHPDKAGDQSGTRTTITKYSDGSTLVVTQTLKSDGTVKKTKSVTTKGTGGGGGGTPVGSSTVHTEKQQLRNTGRLGRVSWHELIRD